MCLMIGTTQGSGLGRVALLLLALAAGARAQLAPGPLSRAHKSLSGPTQCTSCHKAGGGRRDLACLDCHKEIAARIGAQRGFHGLSLSATASSRDCLRCHAEHKGEDVPLVRWEPSQEGFDHRKTGYTLEGKHATVGCNKCHTPEHVAAADREEIQIKDLRRTFWGLRRQCLSCHQDKHAAQLGNDCQKCHTFDDFKKPGSFDHEKTKFPRVGAHLQVQCQKCHQPRADGVMKFVGLAYGQCADCHRDPHGRAFKNPCQSCHEAAGWRRAMASIADKFDHQKTKYPRLGKHAGVDCLKCHAGGDFKRPVAFKKCSDCHKPDPHSAQFAARADRGECNACHTVEGFKPVRFGAREHSATKFALDGKHAELSCAKCHLPAGRATIYRLNFGACRQCHNDQHQGQFAAAPYRNRCEECHTAQGYIPSLFTVARHESTRFPLAGGHVRVECAKCHKPDAIKKLPGSFRFQDRTCAGCHQDPHREQFRRLITAVTEEGSVAGCQICHVPKSWKDVRFEHDVEDFKLGGKHRVTACIKCHKPATAETPLKEVDFKSAPTKCEKCHKEPHLGQFARADGVTACAECHSSEHWKPASFNHDRTSFPLPGRHRTAPCAGCHKLTEIIDGKPVIKFKPTPQDCNSAGCHKHPV
jgi:hypothetical protein